LTRLPSTLDNPPVDRSARQLIAAAIDAHDERAFASLLDQHYGRMLRLARALAADHATAVAAVGRAWEAALRGDGNADEFPSLTSWLLALALAELPEERSLADQLRDCEDVGTDLDGDSFEGEGRWSGHWRDDAMPAPWDEGGAPDSGRELLSCVRELPPPLAALLVLADVERLDSLEIAAVLSVTRQRQLALLHRARTTLRRIVDRRVTSEVASA
jgi:RNA polymerase sigma-70 factor (ECF subfamily)